MSQLIYCKCGLTYWEQPESYSASNPHPHNFCPACDRVVTPTDVSIEEVPESIWIHTPKNHYHPNWLKG